MSSHNTCSVFSIGVDYIYLDMSFVVVNSISATTPSTLPASSTPSMGAALGTTMGAAMDAAIETCYINRLPIELLAAILEEHSVLELHAPFIDSQVCRRWHEATQLWPRVWSYITIRSVTQHKMPINRFKLILKRSRDSPLHVNLEYPYFDTVQEYSAIMLFQRPTIARIQVLLLKGRLPREIREMEGMPNLRVLQLIECDWGGTIKFLLHAKSFPLLDKLVVHHMGLLPRVAPRAPIRLRTISFCYVEHLEWVKILSECRETLVEVYLWGCRLPPPAQIYLPNLKFLVLSNMLNFRNEIIAPGLVTFHEHLEHLAPLKLPFTFSSITEYACQMTSPSIGDEPLLAERVLPELERFVMWGTWSGIREVLRGMVSHLHAVPKLNTIELATDNGANLSDTQWAELEKLVVHTPLSSILKRRTDSRVYYAGLCFPLVCGSSVIAIHILMPLLETLVSHQSLNSITSILVTRLI